MDRIDHFNRVLWTCVAVILTAAGAIGVAAGLGYLRGFGPYNTLLPRWALDPWRAWNLWAWIGIAVAGLVLAWLGWLLLGAESRRGGRRALPTDLTLSGQDTGRDRSHETDRETGDGQAAGVVRLRSPALAHATETALEQHPAVRHALVGLFGDIEHSELRARIDTDADTAIDQALTEHLAHTLKQLTATSGLRPDPVRVTVRTGDTSGPRVH